MEIGPHEIDRFLVAQHTTHEAALAEIKAGRKATHWMWWEFPQLRGLGRSHRATHYGIEDMDEAVRYLNHPVLGAHLVDLASRMLAHQGTGADEILGPVDAQKLQSCATLFAAVPGATDVFDRVLDAFFDGHACAKTSEMLGL